MGSGEAVSGRVGSGRVGAQSVCVFATAFFSFLFGSLDQYIKNRIPTARQDYKRQAKQRCNGATAGSRTPPPPPTTTTTTTVAMTTVAMTTDDDDTNDELYYFYLAGTTHTYLSLQTQGSGQYPPGWQCCQLTAAGGCSDCKESRGHYCWCPPAGDGRA